MVSLPEHDLVVLPATSAAIAGVAGGAATGVLLGVPVSAGAALLAAASVGMKVAEASALLVDVGLAEVDAAHRKPVGALAASSNPVYSASNSSRGFRTS